MDKVIGIIIQRSGIKGNITQKQSIGGTVGIPFSGKKYTGQYEVTPNLVGTTLETANKILIDDIHVKEIPYHETSNVGGGKTIVIAQEE